MKKKLILVISLTIVFLLVNAVIAAKPPPKPGYSGLPLKALNTCLEACGKAPDSKDLEAMYDYEMCIADCHPKIDFLHQSLNTLEDTDSYDYDECSDIDQSCLNFYDDTALATRVTTNEGDIAINTGEIETNAADIAALAAEDELDYDECSDIDCGFLTSVSWGDILSIPAGFEDGVDDDTPPTTVDIEALGFVTGPHTTDTDTNAATICPSGTYLNGDGTCDPASNIVSVGGGLTLETDPEVELVTNGMWCRGTGSAVTCDQDAPTCDCDLTAVWDYITQLEERILALEEACEPSTEVCDGVDNDCDGLIDENFPDLNDICYAGLGVCRSSGNMVCNTAQDGTECDAVLGSPTETPETTCNDGLDNDCDGNADCDDTDCTGDPDCIDCTDNDGDGYYAIDPSCAGSNDCDDGDSDVYPGAPEKCSGTDEDCDGEIDEDNPEGGGACDTGLPGVCAAGTINCIHTELWCESDTPASPEVCDGLDNDCNSLVDENLGQTTCGIGECQVTVNNCVGGVPQECVPLSPSTETCDGKDNNCDGTIDEGGVCASCTGPCTACDDGVCTACPMGYEPNGNTCASCPPGTYNADTGSGMCINCAAGTYSSIFGAASCMSCAPGYISNPGATSCDIDYTDDCSPNPCVSGSTCTDTGVLSYVCSCPPMGCNDNIYCTTDMCDPQTGSCMYLPLPGCDPGCGPVAC